mgnify:CR=1 FL=1
MQDFYLDATKSSPEVYYEAEQNTLEIKGESYPENAFNFYQPVIEMINKAISEKGTLTLIAEIIYLNTSSTKSFMNILDILDEAYQEGKNVAVKWYYEKDNEHSYELALEFKEYLELPFEIIAKS